MALSLAVVAQNFPAQNQGALGSPLVRVTTGPVASDLARSTTIAWADYDSDSWLDLFVGNAGGPNHLYHNLLGQSFEKIISGPIVTDSGTTAGAVWGDYNNDGRLDLFVSRGIITPSERNVLYRNAGNGTFVRVDSPPITADNHISHSASWADYDRDGWLDLFVANWGFQNDVLYHNEKDGTFRVPTLAEAGAILTDRARSNGSSWADFDNDGDPDLFAGVSTFGIPGAENLLYRNKGETGFPVFEKITGSPVLVNKGVSDGPAWGDYDNDGDLDLFVAGPTGQGQPQSRNYLFRNDNGSFVDITNSTVTALAGESTSGSWGDYDNDGWLDLFVTNGRTLPQNNQLFHNNRDGTFTEIRTGGAVNDGGYSYGCSWADYNNDGFLDLAVANGGLNTAQQNFLYRNTPNSNSWLTVRCRGVLSNRAAIGAKIRVLAQIDGRMVWQLREISGGAGIGSQPSLIAHFGCGDAQLVDVVRIEWPSGVIQEKHNVQLNDWLTFEEDALQVGPYIREMFYGSPLEITVTRAAEQALFTWEFNGKPLLDQTSPVLRIAPFRAENEGSYRVHAAFDDQILTSKPIEVRAVKSMLVQRPVGTVVEEFRQTDFVFAGGIWLVGHREAAQTSKDLQTWQRLPVGFPGKVVSANGRFFTLSDRGIASSRDGAVWDQQLVSTNIEFTALHWDGKEFLALGYDRNERIWLARSASGEDWTTLNLNLQGTPRAFASGNGTHVFLMSVNGGGSFAATSPDGNSWTIRPFVENENYFNLLFANDRFFAGGAVDIGDGSVMAIGISADGLNWSKARLDRLTGSIQQIAYANGLYTAFGTTFIKSYILHSTNGLDWAYRDYSGIAYRLAEADDRLVTLNLDGAIFGLETVTQPAVSPRFLSGPKRSGQGMVLPIEVIVPGEIQLEASPDLVNWSSILTTNVSRDFEASDPTATHSERRFYRLRAGVR